MSERFQDIALTVNGEEVREHVDARKTLVDFLREDLSLTGSHVGCEHGVCGACTVRVDGVVVRGCLMLAAQCDGTRVETIEGVSDQGEIADLQSAFEARNALQCGYCTPGMLIAAQALLNENARPSEEQIREAISGNLCRCTGYQQIVDAIALLEVDNLHMISLADTIGMAIPQQISDLVGAVMANDDSLRAYATVFPVPLEAETAGCRLWLELLSTDRDRFRLSGTGFQGGAEAHHERHHEGHAFHARFLPRLLLCIPRAIEVRLDSIMKSSRRILANAGRPRTRRDISRRAACSG